MVAMEDMSNNEQQPKTTKVIISYLAFIAASPIMPAGALPTVNCSQGLNFGGVLHTNGGTLILAPNSAYSAIGGINVVVLPQPGQCFIQTTAATPAKSAVVSIGTKRTNILNGTGEKMKITNFNIDTAKGGRTRTYNSMSLSAGFNINIGGSAEYSSSQSLGSYSGNITITVTTP